jgi:hypothetical protein
MKEAALAFALLAPVFLYVWRRVPPKPGEEIGPWWLLVMFLFCWIVLTAVLLTGPGF